MNDWNEYAIHHKDRLLESEHFFSSKIECNIFSNEIKNNIINRDICVVLGTSKTLITFAIEEKFKTIIIIDKYRNFSNLIIETLINKKDITNNIEWIEITDISREITDNNEPEWYKINEINKEIKKGIYRVNIDWYNLKDEFHNKILVNLFIGDFIIAQEKPEYFSSVEECIYKLFEQLIDILSIDGIIILTEPLQPSFKNNLDEIKNSYLNRRLEKVDFYKILRFDTLIIGEIAKKYQDKKNNPLNPYATEDNNDVLIGENVFDLINWYLDEDEIKKDNSLIQDFKIYVNSCRNSFRHNILSFDRIKRIIDTYNSKNKTNIFIKCLPYDDFHIIKQPFDILLIKKNDITDLLKRIIIDTTLIREPDYFHNALIFWDIKKNYFSKDTLLNIEFRDSLFEKKYWLALSLYFYLHDLKKVDFLITDFFIQTKKKGLYLNTRDLPDDIIAEVNRNFSEIDSVIFDFFKVKAENVILPIEFTKNKSFDSLIKIGEKYFSYISNINFNINYPNINPITFNIALLNHIFSFINLQITETVFFKSEFGFQSDKYKILYMDYNISTIGSSSNKYKDNYFDLESKTTKILSNYLLDFSFDKHFEYSKEIEKHSLKSAIISILVDSFAHNISAHSLSSIVWLYLKRTSTFNKRFLNIDSLKRDSLELDVPYLEELSEKAVQDYDSLGLKDSTHNEISFSLQDLFEFMNEDINSKIFSFNELPYNIDAKHLKINPFIPIPIDKELLHLLKYLKNKSAFWNGVTRDLPFGGEISHWYDVVYEFANNPLFLGTIAHSEGINRVIIKVGYNKKGRVLTKSRCEKFEKPTEEFLTIDISDLMKQDEIENKKEKNDKESSIKTDKLNTESKLKKDFPFKHIFFGKCYGRIRKDLSGNEFDVFLPGGIVGKHALYTTFENTIRNIKHVSGCPEEIELNIYIDRISDKLFNIHIWLGNMSKVTNEKIKDMEYLLRGSIITDDGKPILGGSSQDKICASMLFNNVFSKVEDKNITYQDQNMYPWISIKPLNGEKIVKRSFYLWQGALYLPIKSEQDLIDENPSRFKFVIIEDNHKVLTQFISENGLIRIVNRTEINETYDDNDNIINEDKLYRIWNKKLFDGRNDSVCLGKGNTIKYRIHKKDDNWIIEENNSAIGSTISIYFAHGETDNGIKTDKLQYRNHGQLRDKFFDSNFNFKDDVFKGEFIETLLIRIVIFDNRIHNRVSEQENKIDLFKNKLFLDIKKEKDGETEENNADALLECIKNEIKPNFLILHLSYIESLPKKNNPSTKYKETDIQEFVEDYLTDILSDNTKLIITTGRGRSLWWDNLQKARNQYIKHILFKPIESILSAVEDGLIFKDDFMVKYNLVKVLIGS